MITADFAGVQRVLCVGAHPDDIEIGCGGTLLRLLDARPDIEVTWAVFSGNARRQREARAGARRFLSGVARPRIRCYGFQESFFPSQWARIKRQFETLGREADPDLVFTHHREDRHQDHSVLSNLAWNTFRHHLILEYEIPKYDGDLSAPNVFVPISAEICARKLDAILEVFKSQRPKHWFCEETFRGLMRLRGVECGVTYAEAFHGRKLIWQAHAPKPA